MKSYPDAYGRSADGIVPPSPEILTFMSRLREEPDSDDGSSPDDGVVGIGYTQRQICDGQSLASPGRWAPASRVYPTSQHWKLVADRFIRFSDIMVGVRGFHAREYQKGPVRAIVEGDLFLSARSSFFFLSFFLSFILSFFCSHPDSCLKIKIFVVTKRCFWGGLGGGGGARRAPGRKNMKKTEK